MYVARWKWLVVLPSLVDLMSVSGTTSLIDEIYGAMSMLAGPSPVIERSDNNNQNLAIQDKRRVEAIHRFLDIRREQ
jgi:hypothetical protein